MRRAARPALLVPFALLLPGCPGEAGDDTADTACADCTSSDFGPGRAEDACSPDDGAAVEFVLGLAEATCDAETSGGPLLRLVVFDHGAPLAPGSYALDGWGSGFVWLDADADGEADLDATSGLITIEGWSGDQVTGSYAVDRGDAATLVGDFAVAFCETDPVCG